MITDTISPALIMKFRSKVNYDNNNNNLWFHLYNQSIIFSFWLDLLVLDILGRNPWVVLYVTITILDWEEQHLYNKNEDNQCIN